MKRFATFLLALSSGVLAAGQQPPMPKPGPEHQRLSAFVGTWTFEGEAKPGPMGPGGKMTGSDRIQWMPGNFFLERRFEGKGPMGEIKGLEIIGYDSAKKVHTYRYFDNMGMTGSGTFAIKGDTWTATGTSDMGGTMFHERCNLTFGAGATTLAIKCDSSPDGKSWAPTFEGKATKGK
jgi:hypothetical protein